MEINYEKLNFALSPYKALANLGTSKFWCGVITWTEKDMWGSELSEITPLSILLSPLALFGFVIFWLIWWFFATLYLPIGLLTCIEFYSNYKRSDLEEKLTLLRDSDKD